MFSVPCRECGAETFRIAAVCLKCETARQERAFNVDGLSNEEREHLKLGPQLAPHAPRVGEVTDLPGEFDSIVEERDRYRAAHEDDLKRIRGVEMARDQIGGWLTALRVALDGGTVAEEDLHADDLARFRKVVPAADQGTVLEEAARIVGGARQATYGPPERSFDTIAQLWTTYLGIALKPRDVCHLMILMKVARDVKGGKRDNLVDIAGYARCAEIVSEETGRATCLDDTEIPEVS